MQVRDFRTISLSEGELGLLREGTFISGDHRARTRSPPSRLRFSGESHYLGQSRTRESRAHLNAGTPTYQRALWRASVRTH
jgi:hypothetical protein